MAGDAFAIEIFLRWLAYRPRFRSGSVGLAGAILAQGQLIALRLFRHRQALVWAGSGVDSVGLD